MTNEKMTTLKAEDIKVLLIMHLQFSCHRAVTNEKMTTLKAEGIKDLQKHASATFLPSCRDK